MIEPLRAAVQEAPEVPPVVQAWIAQLLDGSFLALMRSYPAEQVDVRLSASRGRVRRTPVLMFNGGPQPMDDIG
ncbi:MAG: hypothetical protein ACOYY2_03970 [Actinomycetota bacterium]